MKHKISLVMPCHNEGIDIYRNLHETIKTMNELKAYNIDYEIILADDGSTDNTLREAKLVKSKKLRIVSYKPNKGKGHALKYGFQFAKGDLITFVDSDLEIHPRQLHRFVTYVSEYGADMVMGSKSHPDSKVNYPLKRKILSFGYHMFVKLLFGLYVRDTQSGMKLMTYKFAKKVLPKAVVKQYAFDLELLVIAKKLGFNVKEAPIEVRFNFNKSSIGFRSIWPIFQDTLGIAYRKYMLGFYDRKGKLPKVNRKGMFKLFSWVVR